MHMDKIYFARKKKLNVTIQQNNGKMFNFDYITKEDIEEHNPNWPKIPDHPYRILIFRGSGSGKANALLHLINHELDIDKKIFMLKIHMIQSTGSKYINDSKVF